MEDKDELMVDPVSRALAKKILKLCARSEGVSAYNAIVALLLVLDAIDASHMEGERGAVLDMAISFLHSQGQVKNTEDMQHDDN